MVNENFQIVDHFLELAIRDKDHLASIDIRSENYLAQVTIDLFYNDGKVVDFNFTIELFKGETLVEEYDKKELEEKLFNVIKKKIDETR